jgi:acetyltransferase-like isoleucine patch superfamily enzyme
MYHYMFIIFNHKNIDKIIRRYNRLSNQQIMIKTWIKDKHRYDRMKTASNIIQGNYNTYLRVYGNCEYMKNIVIRYDTMCEYPYDIYDVHILSIIDKYNYHELRILRLLNGDVIEDASRDRILVFNQNFIKNKHMIWTFVTKTHQYALLSIDEFHELFL